MRRSRSARAWQWSKYDGTCCSLMGTSNLVFVRRCAGLGVRQSDAAEDFVEAAFFGVQLLEFPAGLRDGVGDGASKFAVANLVSRENARPNEARLFADDVGFRG